MHTLVCIVTTRVPVWVLFLLTSVGLFFVRFAASLLVAMIPVDTAAAADWPVRLLIVIGLFAIALGFILASPAMTLALVMIPYVILTWGNKPLRPRPKGSAS